MTERKEDKMKNEKFPIENPIFWLLLIGTGYMALTRQHWPSMVTLLFFIAIVIPSQFMAMRKRDDPE